MSEENVENSREQNIFLKIVERFEQFESKSIRYQIASEEFLASLRENKSHLVTERLVLTLAGSKEILKMNIIIKEKIPSV